MTRRTAPPMAFDSPRPTVASAVEPDRPRPTTNRWLLGAGVLAILTDVVHLFGGGPAIVDPLMASALGDEPRLVLLSVWHMATVAMGLSGLAFILAAKSRNSDAMRPLVIFISVMWIGFGLSFVWVAASEGASLLDPLNQPILLLPVGLLGMAGANSSTD